MQCAGTTLLKLVSAQPPACSTSTVGALLKDMRIIIAPPPSCSVSLSGPSVPKAATTAVAQGKLVASSTSTTPALLKRALALAVPKGVDGKAINYNSWQFSPAAGGKLNIKSEHCSFVVSEKKL